MAKVHFIVPIGNFDWMWFQLKALIHSIELYSGLDDWRMTIFVNLSEGIPYYGPGIEDKRITCEPYAGPFSREFYRRFAVETIGDLTVLIDADTFILSDITEKVKSTERVEANPASYPPIDNSQGEISAFGHEEWEKAGELLELDGTDHLTFYYSNCGYYIPRGYVNGGVVFIPNRYMDMFRDNFFLFRDLHMKWYNNGFNQFFTPQIVWWAIYHKLKFDFGPLPSGYNCWKKFDADCTIAHYTGRTQSFSCNIAPEAQANHLIEAAKSCDIAPECINKIKECLFAAIFK